MKVETTTDIAGQNPRPRWTIDIAPLSLPGYLGQNYQQIKTFSLSDTLIYKAGAILSFHYQLAPFDQQTQWNTPREWKSFSPVPVLGQRLPELTLSNNKLL